MNKEKVTVISAGGVYKVSYNLDVSDVIDTKVYDTSRSGAIPEMIPCDMQDEGGARVFTYEVDDKKPLVEVLRSEMNKKQMLTLMYNVLQGLEAFGKNMISLSYVAKDAQRVFASPDTLEVGYIVAPVHKEVTDLNEVRDFIKSIIIDARYSLMDTDNYVAKLINYTNMMGTFSVSDMKNEVGNMLMEIGVDIEMINSSRAASPNGPVGGNSHILRGDAPAPKVSRLGVMRNNARMNGQMPPMGPNGQMPPMGMPNGQMPPMGMPNGQMPPMGMPNGQMRPMGMPNGQMRPMGPNGQMPPMGMPNGQMRPMGPNGQMPPMGMPNGQMRPMGMPNGQMPPMGPNGQVPPMGMSNGQMPPMGPNGQIPPMGPNGQVPAMGMPPVGPNAQVPEAEAEENKPEDIDEIKTVKDIPEQPETAAEIAADADVPAAENVDENHAENAEPTAAPEDVVTKKEIPENVDDVLTQKDSVENGSADHIDDAQTVKEQPAGNPFGGNPFGGNGNPFGGNPFGGNPFGRQEPMGVPPMKDIPQMENKAEMPKVPPMPVVPPMPDMPQMENKTEMPKVPPIPAVPPMPETPKVQPTPGVPLMPGVPPMMGGNPFDEIPMPYFVRVKTGEKIRLDKDEFKIGHKAKIVDYAVSDNSAISRVHCIITKKNGVCFIKDNKSTNGTFLNGEELKEGEEKFLTNNAVVILGDEEFVYHVR